MKLQNQWLDLNIYLYIYLIVITTSEGGKLWVIKLFYLYDILVNIH